VRCIEVHLCLGWRNLETLVGADTEHGGEHTEGRADCRGSPAGVQGLQGGAVGFAGHWTLLLLLAAPLRRLHSFVPQGREQRGVLGEVWRDERANSSQQLYTRKASGLRRERLLRGPTGED
jgi:hypothetical protein